MLETPRLLLRGFTSQDAENLYAYLSDPEVVRYEPYPPFTRDACRREAARRAKDSAFWAVCLRDTGQLIGNLYLAEQSYGTWELGYVFAKTYQGQGYATEAARAIVDFAICERSARRVNACCNPENIRSWRLLERLGLRREAHLRQNIYFKTDADGQPLWQDTFEYAILASEWLARPCESADILITRP